jgi:hypothetical protein
MTKFNVSGPFAFRGHAPGETFDADPKDKVIVAAVRCGSIAEEKATKGAASKDDKSGDAGKKEA